jgi:uncharacterized protein
MAKEGGDSPRARITVKVQPRAKVTRIAGKMQHAYRLQLAAPPVDGKANDECIIFLATVAGVPKSRVRIISGMSGRIKIVEINGIAQAEMEARLE